MLRLGPRFESLAADKRLRRRLGAPLGTAVGGAPMVPILFGQSQHGQRLTLAELRLATARPPPSPLAPAYERKV